MEALLVPAFKPNIDIALLIREVEAKRGLWDLNSSLYANKPLKKRTWGKVGEVCGCTGAQAQAKFRNLRTAYHRRKNKLVPSDSGAEGRRQGSHHYDLHFLDTMPKRGEKTTIYVDVDDDGCITTDDGCITAEDDCITAEDGCITAEDDCITAEDGCITTDDGTITADDGSITAEDGCITTDDGTITADDGTITAEDGCITADDGTITAEDGCITAEDGCITADDGTITAHELDSRTESLLVQEISHLRETTAPPVKRTDDFDVFGQMLAAEMRAMTPARLGAFKAKVFRLLLERYEE